MAITKNITAIPKAGKRGIDTRDAFVTKQEAFQDALTDTFVTEINAFRTQANTLETNVNNKEASATQSATTATTKATEASSSATSALDSKNASKTSETNASASEVLAGKWANENENVIVQSGKYSAKHYALKAEGYMNMSDAVKLSGDQTIAGVKKFSSTIAGSINGNSATATKLETARTIGGVSFDGSANINLSGVNTTGNQNTTGNAATATKLQTARTINGTSFDGSANITTANWGTARDITIGNATKSVNGSANVSFSLAEIGAFLAIGKAPNGYTYFNNEFLVQWGALDSGGTVTFPIAFPNAAWRIFITPNHNHIANISYAELSPSDVTKTSFTTFAPGQKRQYLAIGY